uniref:Uncharacterized protein n=1 Tax=viral metagenome TaxID=1070528 RepID=A0A6H1ZLR8_9ZZZZ
MKARLKAIVTIEQEYEADSEHYNNCDYAKDMAEIDKRNFTEDPLMFVDGMIEAGATAKIKITVVK